MLRGGFELAETSGIPVTGVCELALEMNDLEAGERFYSGLLGFPVVGTLPGCYRDVTRGDVDAVVLHRELGER